MEGGDIVCPWCNNIVCVALQFEADIMDLRNWHKRAAALSSNRERRKFAFRTYNRWKNGPGGGRNRLEKCVLVGIRCMFPSEAYMGHHDYEDRSVRRRAVDMMGNRINAWWVFRNGGWELEKE